MKKILVICFLLFSRLVYADTCSYNLEQAHDLFSQAGSTFKNSNYQQAENLYQRAADRYKDAKYYCSGFKKEFAQENYDIAVRNKGKARRNIEIVLENQNIDERNAWNGKYCTPNFLKARGLSDAASTEKDLEKRRVLLQQAEKWYRVAAQKCRGKNQGIATENADKVKLRYDKTVEAIPTPYCKANIAKALPFETKALDAGENNISVANKNYKSAIAILEKLSTRCDGTFKNKDEKIALILGARFLPPSKRVEVYRSRIKPQ